MAEPQKADANSAHEPQISDESSSLPGPLIVATTANHSTQDSPEAVSLKPQGHDGSVTEPYLTQSCYKDTVIQSHSQLYDKDPIVLTTSQLCGKDPVLPTNTQLSSEHSVTTNPKMGEENPVPNELLLQKENTQPAGEAPQGQSLVRPVIVVHKINNFLK